VKTRTIAPLALALLAWGCGGSEPDQGGPPAVDVTGTWAGTVSSSDVGDYAATMTLSQVGGDLTGTYTGSVGVQGVVQGTVSGSTLSFVINVPRTTCSARFVAGAEVDPANRMALAFNLMSPCGGTASGSATLTRQ
jgi:hypothetical protein